MFSLVCQIAQNDKDRFLAYMEASASLGLIFGPPVGAILYGEFGFAVANYVFGVVTVVSIVIIALLIPS
jgi:predicted MFS family arabinose efflux permease